MLAFGPGSLFIIFDILGLFILLMNCTDVDPTLLGTLICFLGSSWSDNIALVILLWLLKAGYLISAMKEIKVKNKIKELDDVSLTWTVLYQ